MTEIEKEIKDLRAEIEHHNELYYEKAQPEISDFEFDQLLERLKQLETEHPELVTPDNRALGTLCVIDTKRRTLTLAQKKDLLALSRLAMTELELRRSLGDQRRMQKQRRTRRTATTLK